jgi:hypothetical protein
MVSWRPGNGFVPTRRRDNSTVLHSRLFSRGATVGIVDSSQNQTRPARILARPGTRSAGAVCRAAELEGVHEPNPQISGRCWAPVKRWPASGGCHWKERSNSKKDAKWARSCKGDQWNEFIRLLTPDERQAFMVDVWKIINLYCRRIAGELSE